MQKSERARREETSIGQKMSKYYYEGEVQAGRRERSCLSPTAVRHARQRPPASLQAPLPQLSLSSARVHRVVVIVVWRLLCTRACVLQPAGPAQPQQQGCAPLAAHMPSSGPHATTVARRMYMQPRHWCLCLRQHSRPQSTLRSRTIPRARRRSRRYTRRLPSRQRAQLATGAANCGCPSCTAAL